MSIKSVMPSNQLIPHCPFSSCPQFSPTSGSFQMSWLFTSGGPSIDDSALASVFLMYIQSWFPLGLTGLISLQSEGLSRVFSSTTIWKHRFFGTQPSLWFNSHITHSESASNLSPYWPCHPTLTSSKNMASPCNHRGKDQSHNFKIMLTETT